MGLAKGGEEANGENLIELRGSDLATIYAVEAVRQVDHFHFRASMQGATVAKPLTLKGADAWQVWVKPCYDRPTSGAWTGAILAGGAGLKTVTIASQPLRLSYAGSA